jgi:hypothetical protein
MSPDLSVFESHATTEVIENTLKNAYDVFDVDVHVEPANLPEEEHDATLALYLLELEEKVLNNLDKTLLAKHFSEIRSDGSQINKTQKLTEVPEQLAVFAYRPKRLSKKTFILTYTYFEHGENFIVTSIWRRRTKWYCETRHVTKKS